MDAYARRADIWSSHSRHRGAPLWWDRIPDVVDVARSHVAPFHGAHPAAARAAIERAGGRTIKSIRDGVLAAFDGPGRAIDAAREISVGAPTLGLHIRAGLHAGEIELMPGDVAGIAVHVAARVAALAAPDEVLVSSTVRDLVVGSGIAFANRGSRVLKAVPGRWRLYAAELGGGGSSLSADYSTSLQ